MQGNGCSGGGYSIIPNAINTEKFSFDDTTRNKIRRKLKFSSSDIVIGHVGKFEYQKNHDFLIKIFSRIHKESDSYKLLLIGDGSLKDQIKKQVNSIGIKDFVSFVDACENVNEYYNAFDLLCFPSRFEGLGIVIIEAQCNGLQCLVSDNIPSETDITGNVKFLPIDGEESMKSWVRMIKSNEIQRDRKVLDKMSHSGYDIKSSVVRLQKMYEELWETTVD